jgi:hypothetical protein
MTHTPRPSRRAARFWVAVAALLATWTPLVTAQATLSNTTSPNLSGVYQMISRGTTLAGGLRNAGSPGEMALLPAALEQMKTVDLKQDPEKMCQPIGPFRMMAREGTKIELVPALSRGMGMIVMLFEDVSRGHMRTIFLNRAHPEKTNTTWHGDSVGHWEGNILVVDTVGFNERTWLNGAGAQHSDALHLVERVRPILEGRYLEYKVTADDPKVLAKPYTYTRYYEKLSVEIMEDVCEE